MTIQFNANATSGANAPLTPNALSPVYSSGAVQSVQSVYTLSAALTLNQVIPMLPVPNGARITNVVLSTDDLDSNGSPAIVLAVGDTGSATRFISASTVAQAGGVTTLNQHGGHGYKYTADTIVNVKCTTAPATGATSGTIVLTVSYVYDI
jgi:hypothetical protein